VDQQIDCANSVDHDGNPTGGGCRGVGIQIDWQDGPMAGQGQNGAFVEGVINAAINRLEFFQSSKFRCRENALALTKLQEAKHWLNARTADREAKGVEGTHQLRESEGQAA